MYRKAIDTILAVIQLLLILGSGTALTFLSIYVLDYLGIIQAHV